MFTKRLANSTELRKIVVVGGGAGGLELATQLGDRLGRTQQVQVTLVDSQHSHVWKPLLHEMAAGSLDEGVDALSYLAHARQHYFRFQAGRLLDINRQNKTIKLAEIRDEAAELLVPERQLAYDILVLAFGSVSNDFRTPGVQEHCIFLDSLQQAKRFHHRMLNLFLKYSANFGITGSVNVAIVGGGATGVELSAELYNAVQQLSSYGYSSYSYKTVNNTALKVTLLEAGERILPALPPRIATAAQEELTRLGVRILTQTKVTQAHANGFSTAHGEFIAADLLVWSAGIKVSDALAGLAGLEANRLNQFVVRPTLQTTLDESIFAIGDCACCVQADGSTVPPRAQAAHQMAGCALHNIRRLLNGQELKAYRYRDHGSLVSLARYTAVGNLMGNLTRGSMMVEGRLARLVYWSLYRLHHLALHGCWKTALMMLAGSINRVIRPRMKLH